MPNSNSLMLQQGSQGPQVAALQRRLNALGFDAGPADGVFGAGTARAVRAFQAAHGLDADGLAGPHTQAALERASTPASSRPTLREGAQGTSVAELQRKLTAAGLNPGPADGSFGPGTERAVIAFQRAHGLTADGVVGPQTWTKLDGAPAPAPVPVQPGTAGVSLQTLCAIMPNLSKGDAARCHPYLNSAMSEAQINNRMRISAFLAQVAVESGELRYFEEIASGEAYEGRADLGNTQRGDGKRFKGRGPIQLTGRANYRKAGRELGLDLENNPERVKDLDVGFRTTAWYWNDRKLNPLADAGDFREITRRVNGAYGMLAERERYYRRALQLL